MALILPWNCSKITPKLLWNWSETARKLLGNCSETARKLLWNAPPLLELKWEIPTKQDNVETIWQVQFKRMPGSIDLFWLMSDTSSSEDIHRVDTVHVISLLASRSRWWPTDGRLCPNPLPSAPHKSWRWMRTSFVSIAAPQHQQRNLHANAFRWWQHWFTFNWTRRPVRRCQHCRPSLQIRLNHP